MSDTIIPTIEESSVTNLQNELRGELIQPHSLRNVGEEPARFLEFFSSFTNMVTLERPLGPIDQPSDRPSFGVWTVLAPPAVSEAPDGKEAS